MSKPGDKVSVLFQGRQLESVDDLVQVLTENRDAINAMVSRLNQMDESIAKHIATAFPGGDIDGHRRAHEAMIQLAEEKRRLRVAIQEKTLSGLLWGALIALGLAMWTKLKLLLGLPAS